MTSERTKPFPWRCPSCAKKEVRAATVPYKSQVKHDGRLHEVEVPALECAKCEACGDIVFNASSDEQVMRALRHQLRLLQPDEIRERRDAFQLTQKSLAERIGVAAETISRWESGLLIQTRAMDNLLRVFLAFPEVREALGGGGQDPRLGLAVRGREKTKAANDKNELSQLLAAWSQQVFDRIQLNWEPNQRRDLVKRWTEVSCFWTSVAEASTWMPPSAVKALSDSIVAVTPLHRGSTKIQSRHGWIVVNVRNSQPKTNRLATRLREFAEVVEESPAEKAEEYLAKCREFILLANK